MDGYTGGAQIGARHRRASSPVFARLRRMLPFLLLVVLPTGLAGGYLYGVAADQYQSEASFIVRGPQMASSASSGLAAMLGAGTSGANSAQMEAFAVDEYLASHDAVAAINQSLPLAKVFRRPEADPLFGLWWPDPSAETLLSYYRRMVKVTYDDETGISTIRVRAFLQADAIAIAKRLLELGEQRVNAFNSRALDDAMRVTQGQVTTAENRVQAAQRKLTLFRMAHNDIDPSKTSVAQQTLLGRLGQQIAEAQAQRIGLAVSVRPDSPQMVALTTRIRALQAQLDAESERLTGTDGSKAPVLADYEQLVLDREFAQTSYTTAMTAMEAARLQTLRQQLFVVRVVEPNLPEEALYPRSSFILLTIVLGLTISYAILWLLLAGVREHAA